MYAACTMYLEILAENLISHFSLNRYISANVYYLYTALHIIIYSTLTFDFKLSNMLAYSLDIDEGGLGIWDWMNLSNKMALSVS